MRTSRLSILLPFFIAAGLTNGCSDDKGEPMHSPVTTLAPSSSTPPIFSLKQIRQALLIPGDYGATWYPIVENQQRNGLREKKIETCARGDMKVPGTPKIVFQQFGERRRHFEGASHAEMIFLYPTPSAAADAFIKVKQENSKCRPKQEVTRSPLPHSTLYSRGYDATWTPNDEPVGSWERTGGFQKADFPDYVSKFNVIYTAFDYAVRGNVLLVSYYWQGIEPKKSGFTVAKRAETILTKQLERIG